MRNFFKTIFSTEPCKCEEDKERGEMQQALQRNREAIEKLTSTVSIEINKHRQMQFHKAMGR